MKVHLPENIELRAPDGSNVTVDLAKIEMSDKQRSALHSVYGKAFSRETRRTISPEEFEAISQLRSQIQTGPDVAFVVRFDWQWVRIDEPRRTLEEFLSE